MDISFGKLGNFLFVFFVEIEQSFRIKKSSGFKLQSLIGFWERKFQETEEKFFKDSQFWLQLLRLNSHSTTIKVNFQIEQFQ